MVDQQVYYRLLACRFHVLTLSFDERPHQADAPA
jgi:hypothetical protein